MADQILSSNKNFFITGGAGVGKSFLIKELEKVWITQGRCYVILAPTGVAAINIGGSTIHSFFGIGIGSGTNEQLLKSCRIRGGTKKILPLEILIIDEISMVSAQLLESIDYICRAVRRCDEVFGGMRVILTGDFLQLAPVNGSFAFNSFVWKELKLEVLQLNEAKRFNDLSYWKMLNRARVGNLKRKDVARLQECVQEYKKLDLTKTKIQPTILFSHKANVEEINTEKLNELPGPMHTYYSIDKTPDLKDCKTTLDALAPGLIKFKVGAQVMLTRNLSVEDCLCNGSRGVVVECREDAVEVLFMNGKTISIGIQTFEVEGKGFKATRMQIPLTCAWSIVIHKSQSLTLDYAVMDLGSSVFAPGQAYVALSRVKNYKSLLLSNFTEKSIFAHPQAKKFYESLDE